MHTTDTVQLMLTYRDPEALIDDPRVLRVRISENDESLVDVRGSYGLAVDATRADVQQLSDNPFLLRTGVAARLSRAQQQLPKGYRLQVKEAWRPIWVQQRVWERYLARLQDRQPEWDSEQLAREGARFVAPAHIAPPHSTWAAVDLTLLNDETPVDMGWSFNQPGYGSRTDAALPKVAHQNRDLLAEAMHAAGFINYPTEWWHWSYGDRYWAFQLHQDAAHYGPR